MHVFADGDLCLGLIEAEERRVLVEQALPFRVESSTLLWVSGTGGPLEEVSDLRVVVGDTLRCGFARNPEGDCPAVRVEEIWCPARNCALQFTRPIVGESDIRCAWIKSDADSNLPQIVSDLAGQNFG